MKYEQIMALQYHRPINRTAMARRAGTLEAWLNTSVAPADRLLAFEKWLAGELQRTLVLSALKHEREKQTYQCAALVRRFVVELEVRGWLFDGPLLARVIREQLMAIRAQQDKGNVRNLYPYLTRVFDAYVRVRAEELQALASNAGFLASQVVRDMERRVSMTEIVAQDVSQINARKRAAAKAKREAAKVVAEKNKIQMGLGI